MTEFILIAILICLVLLLRIEYKKLPRKVKAIPKRKLPPLTDEQRRDAEKLRIENENFWNYSGEQQEDVESQI